MRKTSGFDLKQKSLIYRSFNMKKLHKETEETFFVYKEQCNDKEKFLNEQIYNLKASEKKMRGL